MAHSPILVAALMVARDLGEVNLQKRLLPDIKTRIALLGYYEVYVGEHELTSQHWGTQQFLKVNDIQPCRQRPILYAAEPVGLA